MIKLNPQLIETNNPKALLRRRVCIISAITTQATDNLLITDVKEPLLYLLQFQLRSQRRKSAQPRQQLLPKYFKSQLIIIENQPEQGHWSLQSIKLQTEGPKQQS